MPEPFALLIIVIIAAVGFGIANGFNDAANSVATVIGTRTLSPRAAIIMAAFFEFAGAATGSAVAITIGKEIVDPEFLTTGIVLSGVVAIIIWALITTHYGMPISLTHGLVAGLVGAGMAMGGTRIIIWRTLARVFSAVGIAPLQGFTATASASTVIELASHYGLPVSTTHCVSSAIMGVGATRRLSAVRWGIAKDIVLTWVLTFPAGIRNSQ